MTSIDITLKSRVIMHIITSTARRPYASTRSVTSVTSEAVGCSSACKDKVRSLALEQQDQVIDD